jgi:hypothetical protein
MNMKSSQRCLPLNLGVTCAAAVACIASLTLTPCPIWARELPPSGGFANTATVSFDVMDGMGNGNLHGGKVRSFLNLKTGRDFAGRFHVNRFLDHEANRIPYGRYDLKFDQPGFPEIERPVDVHEHEVDLEVCVTTATVHIMPVLYTSGAYIDLEAKVVSFKGDDYGLDLASRFKTNTAANVPYGTYDLRVKNQGFASVEQYVDVFQPEVWVLIQPIVGETGDRVLAPTTTLSGTIKNLDPAEEPIYVRLVNIFPNRIFVPADDAKVAVSYNSGTFTLVGGLSPGWYTLVTFGRTGILDSRRVEVTADFKQEPIVIDLGGKRGRALKRQ